MKVFVSFFLMPLILSACTLHLTSPPPAVLGAGFRYSIYGPANALGPAYWTSVGDQMAALFDGAEPMGIWIIGDIEGNQSFLNFPGSSEDPNILFGSTDDNEAALTFFDQHGIRIWLQVEPGDAEILKLIDLVLNQYGQHPCVIGFGVDVEWFRSNGEEADGRPVTDELAAAWVRAIRAHNPDYRLFLKHWDIDWMPATVREGILFVDDSQQFNSLNQMLAEFQDWGEAFAPAPVAYQFGYPDDRSWWGKMENPPSDVGHAILEAVPSTSALFWVDFTILDVFPPEP